MKLFNHRLMEEMQEGGEPAAEAAQSESLIDAAEPTLSDGEWFLTDGVKGSGDRPEWYKHTKYKSLSEQARAYTELEKKFGSFTGAPKDGYKLPDGFESDDALVQEVMKFGAESNMSQDGFNKLLDLAMAQAGVTESINKENELKKLGDNASQRIKTVETFLKNKLKSEEYEEILPLVTSADSVLLLEKMIKATAPTKLPLEGGVHPEGRTWEDVEREMFKKDENGNLLRSVNAEHDAKVRRLIKEFGG